MKSSGGATLGNTLFSIQTDALGVEKSMRAGPNECLGVCFFPYTSLGEFISCSVAASEFCVVAHSSTVPAPMRSATRTTSVINVAITGHDLCTLYFGIPKELIRNIFRHCLALSFRAILRHLASIVQYLFFRGLCSYIEWCTFHRQMLIALYLRFHLPYPSISTGPQLCIP